MGAPVEFGSRAVIFREADSCGSAFALCSGRVKLSTMGADGRTLIQRNACADSLAFNYSFRAADALENHGGEKGDNDD
jgi:hypothetical protein